MELSKNAEDGNKSIASGTKSPKYDFEFDRVFEPGTSQEVVYEEISQLVRSSMDGYNVCVFAYGQTGSGMQREKIKIGTRCTFVVKKCLV